MKRFLIATSIVGALLAFASGVAAQAGAEVALRAAIEKETVKGDLNGAIEQYKKIVAQCPDNHAIAARALLRMAGAYEKLGNPEYKNVYARVAAQYTDQPEAAQARTRLSAKAEATPAVAPTDVLLWRAAGSLSGSSPSPDGSFIVYGRREQGLWRHDFAVGEDRLITADPADVASPKVSPDGRLVAYSLWGADGYGQLRVVGVDGSGMRVLAKIEPPLIAAGAWSPDGTRLLVKHGKNLALLSVADGSMRVVQTGKGAMESTANAFSPDGNYVVYQTWDDRIDDPAKTTFVIWIMNSSGGGAAQILSDPAGVRSASPMWAPDGRSILFQSDRSGSLAFWSVAMADGKAQGAPQLISRENFNCLLLTGDGSLFHSESARQSDVYLAGLDPKTLKVTSPPQQLNRRYIGQAYAARAWSPDGHAVVWRSLAAGSLVIHSMDTGDDKEIKLAGSSAGAVVGYSSDGASLLAQKRAGGGVHFSRIDAQTGNVTALFDLQNAAWAAFSADGKAVYYSPLITPIPVGQDGTVVVRIIRRDVRSGEEAEVVRLDSREGLVELSLSPDGRQIAFGYRGAADQEWWEMVAPTSGGAARKLAPIEHSGMVWTGDSRGLYMAGRLVTDSNQLWLVPADGSSPVALGIRGEVEPGAASPRNDGITFTQSQTATEVKLYKNLLPPAPAQ